MDLRLALYQLSNRHQLDPSAARQLRHIAGLEREPAALAYWLPRGVAVLAAALAGLGIIFWIAANWQDLGRFGRFGLLQAVFLLCCIGALLLPKIRSPLLLLAFLSIGGLFAYFGQTYQTGADPWQLFAVWAVLGLPLCFAARSDVLWAPWALVVSSAISLWVYAHVGRAWQVRTDDFSVYLLAWALALAMSVALAAPLARWTGAGLWGLRTSLVLAINMITVAALGALFQDQVAAQYWVGLLLLGAAVAVFSLPRWHDIFGLCIAALGLNLLLISGFGYVLFSNKHGDIFVSVMILGLAGAALLGVSVHLILLQSRRHEGAAA